MYAIDWSVVVLCPDICHPLLRLTACWPPYQEHPGDHCRSRPRINQLNLVLTTTPGICISFLYYIEFYLHFTAMACSAEIFDILTSWFANSMRYTLAEADFFKSELIRKNR